MTKPCIDYDKMSRIERRIYRDWKKISAVLMNKIDLAVAKESPLTYDEEMVLMSIVGVKILEHIKKHSMNVKELERCTRELDQKFKDEENEESNINLYQ